VAHSALLIVVQERLSLEQYYTGGLNMTLATTTRLTVAINVISMGLLLVQPGFLCAREAASTSQDDVSPLVESVSDTLAFVSWTTKNPGGTILHYAKVHYGKDPNHLDLTAKSPTRINPTHSEMVFRVRMADLEPGTTYYYKVSSEQATGIPDPATSGVNQFTTRATNDMNATK
jgi:hypothetical protein